jgi:hypothetical protein
VANPETVTQLHPPEVPDTLEIDPTGMAEVAMSANELRTLKVDTGKSLSELLGDDADDADRLQVMVWLRLARDGIPCTWHQAGDVHVTYRVASSPDSAGTGG